MVCELGHQFNKYRQTLAADARFNLVKIDRDLVTDTKKLDPVFSSIKHRKDRLKFRDELRSLAYGCIGKLKRTISHGGSFPFAIVGCYPIVRQTRSRENQLSGAKLPNIITNKHFAVSVGDHMQLILVMDMPTYQRVRRSMFKKAKHTDIIGLISQLWAALVALLYLWRLLRPKCLYHIDYLTLELYCSCLSSNPLK